MRKLLPRSVHPLFSPGDFLYVYREGLKYYSGPHMIATVDGKQAQIHLGGQTGPSFFNISQVKAIQVKQNLENQYDNIMNDFGAPCTETIPIGDPREHLFDAATSNEIFVQIERGTFIIYKKPNVLPCLFVLTIKHPTVRKFYKARFIIGGHKYCHMVSMVNQSNNLKEMSITVLLPLSNILGFDIWDLDVKQAYLQSASKFKMSIYIKPEIFYLEAIELLQII